MIDKKDEGFKSHQLSGFSCVSMSTRQIGHFLLVASHWSTQPWWKRCMQGNLLGGQRDTQSVSGLFLLVVKAGPEELLAPAGS